MSWPVSFSRAVRILYGRPYALVFALNNLLFPRLWRDWWYWNKVEDRLLEFVKKTATQGDAASVLAAFEEYDEKHELTDMLEHEKRMKVMEVVKEVSPKVCFEMGGYCGFSAITAGHVLPAGSRLITVEYDPKFADIARQAIHFAGLDQVITVVTAKAEDVIEVLRSEYSVDKLDYVFIDHNPKDIYIIDLKRLEDQKLLRKGTVIMADNTLWPGCPDFLEYVENSDKYKTERFCCMIQGLNEPDAMTISFYAGD